MRILVVEDERALCETIVRSLRRLAYSVDPCYDGDTAIDLLGSERYDLVLLDLNLPGADGMTVLRERRLAFWNTCCSTGGGPSVRRSFWSTSGTTAWIISATPSGYTFPLCGKSCGRRWAMTPSATASVRDI